MRIAFLSTFYPFRGGIAQFNANLYEAALRRGDTVKAFNFTCQYPGFLFPGKTQYVTPQDGAKPIGSEAVLSSVNPFSWRRTAKRIADWKPDVVIVRYWMSFFAPSLGCVARKLRRRGIKVVAILDNVLPHEARFFDRPFSRWFLRSVAGSVSMCRSVEQDQLSLAPELPHRLSPHPLYDHFGERIPREEAQRRLGLDPSRKTLLYFGLIRDYKGLDLLMEAMGLLGDDYQLVAAGECYGSFERYEALAERLRREWREAGRPEERLLIENRYIDDEEVPIFFSAADLCVLPYRSATQSGITAVALHFNLPLVATPVGGLPESVGETGIGRMASAATPKAIAKAVSGYFEEGPEGYLKAIATFKQAATWDHFLEELLQLAEAI